ncbi:DUF2520 domain-containing protein [Microbacterium sp. YY-01]|uniref:DUF2520 domain-containing protein n=1 Tax=Microbacterium sp. YY-01 TaxID=3421634 RepID=UPI003D184404
MDRDGRLAVGIVGAGRVGPVVAAALVGAGHRLVGITAGSDPDRVQAMVPGVPVLDTAELVQRSQLVVLAVPTDQLAALVAGLAEAEVWQMGQLVMHTDPNFGTDVLCPAAQRGAIGLAVHPAISFTGTTLDLRQLQAAYAAVTAPPMVLPIAQALAVELGCEPVVIAEEQRAAYAEAIETASAFTRSIIGQATGLLRTIGVDNPGGYLSALVSSTFERALREVDDGPARGL